MNNYLIPGVLTNDRFSFACIFFQRLTKSKRKRHVKCSKIGPQVNIKKPYMTDEEVMGALEIYGDLGFDKLPDWLRQELEVRKIPWPRREASDLEKWETVEDAREHRIVNKELIIKDYQDKYIRNKPLIVT